MKQARLDEDMFSELFLVCDRGYFHEHLDKENFIHLLNIAERYHYLIQ